jgi:hypothetical protein
MAPYTKLIALCLFGASIAAASPVPEAKMPRSDDKVSQVDIVTVKGAKYALVPVEGDGTISVNKMLHLGAKEKHEKRDGEDTDNTDAVAYNPAYQYLYTTLYMYVTNYGYAN